MTYWYSISSEVAIRSYGIPDIEANNVRNSFYGGELQLEGKLFDFDGPYDLIAFIHKYAEKKNVRMYIHTLHREALFPWEFLADFDKEDYKYNPLAAYGGQSLRFKNKESLMKFINILRQTAENLDTIVDINQSGFEPIVPKQLPLHFKTLCGRCNFYLQTRYSPAASQNETFQSIIVLPNKDMVKQGTLFIEVYTTDTTKLVNDMSYSEFNNISYGWIDFDKHGMLELCDLLENVIK